MQSHAMYTVRIMNQCLYLVNQLRKQRLHVSRLSEVFMALVAARFPYAVPSLAGQHSADDLHKVYAVFNKARKCSLHPTLQI